MAGVRFTAFYGNKVVQGKKVVNTEDGLGTRVEIPFGESPYAELCAVYPKAVVDAWLMNGYRDKLMGICNGVGKDATSNEKGKLDLLDHLQKNFGDIAEVTFDVKKPEAKTKAELSTDDLIKAMKGLSAEALAEVLKSAGLAGALEG